MSAEKIGFPFNVRLIIANSVSNIGIAKIVIGTKKEVSAGPLNSNREIIAIIKPRNVEQSPANILALWKL